MARTGSKSLKQARRGATKAPQPEALRRTELLQIAADLFAEHGYVATTVRDIADEAGILSGSLYHHFDSKESMIDAILSTFVAETLANYEAVVAAGDGPTARFEGLVRVSLRAMSEQRSAILIYAGEARHLTSEPRFAYLAAADRKFERIWVGVLEAGVKSGEFRAGIEPRLVYRLVCDAVWNAPRGYRLGRRMTSERICDQYLAVLVAGVAAESAR